MIMRIVMMLMVGSWAMANDSKVWVFGIVPQQSAVKLVRDWGPVLAAAGEQAGVQLEFATAPDIPTFEYRVANGHYDFAYMNPFHFVEFNRSPGFRALVHAKEKKIQGIVVAKKGSKLEGLKDLQSGELAFPAPGAFAATLLVIGNTQNQGVSIQASFVGSHDAVYRNVASGRFIAGGGIYRTFNALSEDVRSQLEVLWQSPGYTPHAIAAHPRVPEAISKKLQQAFINLGNKELLEPLKIPGFEQAEDHYWDDVRALNINHVLNR